ncbi:3'-5' exonuclease [Sphingopyxis flava]|uniref:DNA polymerase-3 subunit epsilon n=1 Tax=Sphingopyxis flava TaxID=1507287 RepID=A0A1T5ADI4_9SPHN|nr:3'-5' exonuclease [Sphingopyxis flava]SKB32797.1 DNA polymerase-3 subunit epsilon [Sphingopyxis flava]
MKVLIFDTETTGIPLWGEPSDDPRQPYVIELAADLVDFESREIITSLDFLINNDVDIPEEVIAIHGITREMCAEQGISPLEAHEQFVELIGQADEAVGHQVKFDIRMMRIHGARVTGDKWENLVPTYCTMQKAHAHVKALPQKPDGWAWPPTLADTHLHIVGEPFSEAHRARPDCDAARRIYFHIRSL